MPRKEGINTTPGQELDKLLNLRAALESNMEILKDVSARYSQAVYEYTVQYQARKKVYIDDEDITSVSAAKAKAKHDVSDLKAEVEGLKIEWETAKAICLNINNLANYTQSILNHLKDEDRLSGRWN